MPPYTLKWGIMATGKIAERFTRDLLTYPESRNVRDIAHKLVAVSSSTSKDRAEDFVSKIDGLQEVRTYESYEELVADPLVQIVYVATPHSHHFQNAMLALEAGKHVLCEKPVTVTASQARRLVATAQSRNLFFMEAVWTRFLPSSARIREMCTDGVIGKIHRVIAKADVSFAAIDPLNSSRLTFPDNDRMVNLNLAGGALLDLGVYSLTWIFQILYNLQHEKEKERPSVASALSKYSVTGADDKSTILLHFPGHETTGIAMTGFWTSTGVNSDHEGMPSVVIQGSLGEIHVIGPAFNPSQFRVIRKNHSETFQCDYPVDTERDGWGHGMYWEAYECARCIRDGKNESPVLPWDESVAILETIDKVLRDGGVEYPETITSDK